MWMTLIEQLRNGQIPPVVKALALDPVKVMRMRGESSQSGKCSIC